MKFMEMMAVLLIASPVFAQDPSKAKSDESDGITKEQAAKIVQELQMIRMLLQTEIDAKAKDAPLAGIEEGNKTLADLGKNIIGSDKAPITLVEFIDLQCPFCMKFHKDVLPELRRKYIDTGKLRFAAFDFPLPSHAYALPAAIFARCAASEGKYWQVYETFLSSARVAGPEEIQKVAADIQLSPKEVDQCMTSAKISNEIAHAVEVARGLGVVGTPTFLLGKSSPSGATGMIIQGSPSLAVWESQIQKLLNAQQEGQKSASTHD